MPKFQVGDKIARYDNATGVIKYRGIVTQVRPTGRGNRSRIRADYWSVDPNGVKKVDDSFFTFDRKNILILVSGWKKDKFVDVPIQPIEIEL